MPKAVLMAKPICRAAIFDTWVPFTVIIAFCGLRLILLANDEACFEGRSACGLTPWLTIWGVFWWYICNVSRDCATFIHDQQLAHLGTSVCCWATEFPLSQVPVASQVLSPPYTLTSYNCRILPPNESTAVCQQHHHTGYVKGITSALSVSNVDQFPSVWQNNQIYLMEHFRQYLSLKYVWLHIATKFT